MFRFKPIKFWSTTFIIIIIVTTECANRAMASGNCWSNRANHNKDDFVFECTGNGNFKPIQCDKTTGFCFCVDELTGKPIHETTIRSGLPKCENRIATPRPNNPNDGRNARCSTQQLVAFISNLLTTIRSEEQNKRRRITTSPSHSYRFNNNRTPSSPISSSLANRQPNNGRNTVQSNNELIQYDWIINKFNSIDIDADGSVSTEELEKFTSLHRSNIGCVRSFAEFCDSNRDMVLSRFEFLTCVNPKSNFKLGSGYSERRGHQSRDSEVLSKKADSMHSGQIMQSELPAFNIQTSAPRLNPLTDRSVNKNESRLDCLVIRANLIESTNANELLFIPNCTNDGYYVRVQCHLMQCWCVSRVTGQTIKQLNAHSTENSCDQMRKGCDQRRRSKFHSKHRQYLKSTNLNCDKVFGIIDVNHDQMVNDAEWKKYRKRLRKSETISSRLRKCFHTEIQYCDQNEDNLVSKQEWVQCCMDNLTISTPVTMLLKQHNNHNGANSIQHLNGQSLAEAYNAKRNRTRSGPNPLRILKSEKM